MSEQLKICGMMTLPRAVNSWAITQIQKAFNGAGIPLHVGFGVYYGQCMERLLSDAIERGADVIITVDGDSLFTFLQIRRVASLVASGNGFDALAAMQPKRGASILLGYRDGDIDVSGDPVKVSLAHFGLTAINAKKLATVPRPWFFCQPSEDGSWNDGRIDSDIWFWKQWERAGHSVYLDPQTCIGHLEDMVAVVNPKTFDVEHVYPEQWQLM